MKITILKSGRWAQSSPADPQFIVKEGETREDIPDELCRTLIDHDAAEDFEGEDASDDILDLSIPKIKDALPGMNAEELSGLMERENAGKTRSGVVGAILDAQGTLFLARESAAVIADLSILGLDKLMLLRKLEDNGQGREDVIEALKAAISERQA